MRHFNITATLEAALWGAGANGLGQANKFGAPKVKR